MISIMLIQSYEIKRKTLLLLQTLEVKHKHAHVTTQRLSNKFIEINFSIGCMVWP